MGKWLHRFQEKTYEIAGQGTDIADIAPQEMAEQQSSDNELLTVSAADPAKGRELLRQQGYFIMYSQLLCEDIAVVEHDDDRRYAPVEYVTYTLEELTLLADGHRQGHIVTLGDLRQLHQAKKLFQGRIIS
jgi:hypothetical protein